MSKKIKLTDITEFLEMQGPENTSYLDTESRELVNVTEEEFQAAQDGDSLDSYPEWQRENITLAQKISNDEKGRFIALPTQFDLNEYCLLDRFVETVEDKDAYQALSHATRGQGAFRRFKACIHDLGIAEKWYAFKEQSLKEIAQQWCRQNQIDYDDTPD